MQQENQKYTKEILDMLEPGKYIPATSIKAAFPDDEVMIAQRLRGLQLSGLIVKDEETRSSNATYTITVEGVALRDLLEQSAEAVA